jgi:cysteinyl-tRNA synthetase
MGLRVYSTLTRQKQEFQTVRPGKVLMYVCGPTVYKPSHVGHMVGPVIFDTVKRYLTYLGYDVTFVVNITDIDDKIILEAANQKRDWKELAESVAADYLDNLARLGVTSIDHFPRASEYVDEIQRLIAALIEQGYAYASAGDVYFDVSRDSDYGKLCNRDPEQLEAGARVEVSDKKRNPGDFALWKAAKPGEPKWDSPWGPGRPGWHIECSAMSMKLLGETLDIHGGGLDLQFPHHENELAQSESLTNKPFALFWMHNGLMKIRAAKGKIKGDAPAGDGELQKMSKSLGNEIVVREVLKRHDPETLRFLLLSTHYRSPIEYSEDRLVELKRGLEGFYRFFERFERVTGRSFHALTAPTRRADFHGDGALLGEIARLRQTFLDAMDDDFNTGGAIGSLFEMLTTLNRFVDTTRLEQTKAPDKVEELNRAVTVLRELSRLLGVFHEPPLKLAAGDQLVEGLIQLLLDLRERIRAEGKAITDKEQKKKIFGLADHIRERLGKLNVVLEDRPTGTTWRIQ